MLSQIALIAAAVVSQPSSGPQADPEAESKFLSEIRQLTFAEDWAKAGESYFSPDGKWVVFQAIQRTDEEQLEGQGHYAMFARRLEHFGKGMNNRVGGQFKDLPDSVVSGQLSHPGSANTCGWFHPDVSGGYKVIFGSTITPPSAENQPGYQRGSGRYRWAFPSEMNIVRTYITEDDEYFSFNNPGAGNAVEPVFEKPGYTAECSYSPDARHILYAQVDNEKSNELGRPDADLWVYDTETEEHTILVEAEGYDGGPFFSPDGKWICYRSDRKGNNLLQLFVSELAYDESGKVTGISREIQLTDNRHVNWAPFWHPSGEYLLYATSQVSHGNYEVFAIPFDADNPEERHEPIRITYAEGFDGLPVFSNDGEYMMWTAQRGDDRSPDGKASSQLWIAKWNGLGGE